uniref:Uncharacterized protein n=1 Tax=Panagrolaimus superbus TaxID=310955 RepID=A0A914YE28_9BILA
MPSSFKAGISSSYKKEANANIKDLINKFNGNSDPPKTSQDSRGSNKFDLDTENRSGAIKCRSIQRECIPLINDAIDGSKFVEKYEKEEFESTAVDFESAEEHEAKAQELREQAQETLEKNEMEFQQAHQAQTAARIASEIANAKTDAALEHQEIGQELLVEAGAKLIEAGAKLQEEAMETQMQLPFNVHQEGEIQQTTYVSTVGIEAAAAAHDIQTFREVEHLPETAHSI